jgi:hypothetical protein
VEATDALERLHRIFAGLHASRQADVDEYNIVMHSCPDPVRPAKLSREEEGRQGQRALPSRSPRRN